MSDESTFQSDPFSDPPPLEPPKPASSPWDEWDDQLYDRLNDIVDDEMRATLSRNIKSYWSRDRVIMLAGILVVLVGFWFVSRTLANRGPSSQPADNNSAPVAAPQATYTPTPLGIAVRPPSPTPTPTPTPLPGIAVGARVRVIITDGSGMRFRTGPGSGYITLAIVPDGTVFKVVDGPVESEGRTWWRLEAEDGTIGWGAAELLELVGE